MLNGEPGTGVRRIRCNAKTTDHVIETCRIEKIPTRFVAAPDGLIEATTGKGTLDYSQRAVGATLKTVSVLLDCSVAKSVESSGLNIATLESIPSPTNGAPAIGDKTPFMPMSKTSTFVLVPLRATKSCVLAQLQSIPAAPATVNGEPAAGASAPAVEMVNINIDPKFADTARNFPSEVALALTNGPLAPLANGDPRTGLRVPFAPTLNTVIVADVPFAAIRNFLSGVAVNDIPEPAIPPWQTESRQSRKDSHRVNRKGADIHRGIGGVQDVPDYGV